ncbi:class I SAM-dependent methyltransferase [Gorillibacterium sp. sgz5001074]|uniref:class I SAM-dependent methyltransferase n=1 Tax=Gorillibacterium sp. sgz5001074 TaxID=3446695 RepID=UPI003F67525E
MGEWFPRQYDRLMAPLERRRLQEVRRALVGQAAGRVLEIGSGTGLNFPYYAQAEEVTAVEPGERMREHSLVRAEAADVPIRVVDGSAEKLPFGDGIFDTVVCTLVLCTVEDPLRVLAELRRVCKPGGRLLFLEHVRLERRPLLAKLQDVLTPLWKRLCDGCRLNRSTSDLIRRSGIEAVRTESFYGGLFLILEGRNGAEASAIHLS